MKHAYTFFTFLCLLFGSVSLAAQSTISGTIKDKGNGEALAGATIQIKGTVTSTVSRADGGFAITTRESLPLTLRVSYLGYAVVEVSAAVAAGPH